MLKHEFTFREKILLVIAVVLALGIFYYEVAWKGFQSAYAQYNTADLEDQLNIAQAQAVHKKQMEKAVEDAKGQSFGSVEPYDNIAAEVNELGNILEGKADNINITWSQPTLTDTTVRRTADISFTTSAYSQAEALIQSIEDCRYRCIISSLEIDAPDDSLSDSGEADVSLQVTFFETTDGASTTAGLVTEQNDNTATPDPGTATYN